MHPKLPNQIGLRYGRLIVREYGKVVIRKKHVICRCDCGNTVEIALSSLRSGHSISCGCYRKEVSSHTFTTHGYSRNPLYKTFKNIRTRCNNVQSTYYGGRGIKCKWNSFDEFYNDMYEGYEKGLQIDRIDNNGDYCKENCRWVTPQENVQNRRNTIVTAEIAQRCADHGIKYHILYYYMNRYGMSAEEVINKKTR